MRFALLSLLTMVASGTNLYIQNSCPFKIWYRLNGAGTTGGSLSIDAGGHAVYDGQGANNALLFGKDAAVSGPVQFDYSIKDATIWYDASDGAGLPFALAGVPNLGSCAVVGCPAGTWSDGSPYDCKSIKACTENVVLAVVACPGPTTKLDLGPRH